MAKKNGSAAKKSSSGTASPQVIGADRWVGRWRSIGAKCPKSTTSRRPLPSSAWSASRPRCAGWWPRSRLAPSVRHQAKDLLRASGLALLPVDNVHVAADLAKINRGEHLSPVLLVRGDFRRGVPLTIADGYHRVCASYHVNENADIPCHLVDHKVPTALPGFRLGPVASESKEAGTGGVGASSGGTSSRSTSVSACCAISQPANRTAAP